MVTDKQIRQLRSEAAEAGDTRMHDICDIALDEHDDQADEWVEGASGEPMTAAEARAECERVISDAAAQDVMKIESLEWDDGTDATDRGWWYRLEGADHSDLVVSGTLTAQSDRETVIMAIEAQEERK